MRIVMVVGFVIAAVLASVGDSAFAQEIKISHQWAEGTDGRDRATRVFVQEVEARANGLKFRIYPNSSLNVKPAELLAALQTNTVAMAVYPLTYGVTKVPEFSLAGLPGLVPDLDAAHALKGCEIHSMLQSLAEANGIRIVTWWWSPGGLFAKNRQISDPASVRGLRMRAADPLFELMLKGAGASVTNMPSTDIYAAMQSNTLDAIGTTYEAFMSLRLSEQAKFATVSTSLHGVCPLVMSLKTWTRSHPTRRPRLRKRPRYRMHFRDIERPRAAGSEDTSECGRHHPSHDQEDFVSWLQLAQQTAWLNTRKSPSRPTAARPSCALSGEAC